MMQSAPSIASATHELRAATHGVSSASGLEADWVPIAVLAADPAPWRELARAAIEPNIFLDPRFATAAARHLVAGELGAVVVRHRARLAGLLPGSVEGVSHGRPLSTFVAWTHPFAPLSTPLIDREMAADVVAAMLGHLPKLSGAPRLALFPLLAEQGAVARLIAAELARTGRAPHRLAPHRRAALLPGVSRQRLEELRRERRQLSDAGAFTHEFAEGGAAIAPALADFFDVEAAGWKGREGGAAKHDLAAARFITEAISGLAAERKARIDLLKFADTTIAATITLYSGDRAWLWKSGCDDAFAPYLPGVQLALELTEALIAERNLSLADACAAADPTIDRLWSGRIAMADWLVPLERGAAFPAGIAAERMSRAAVVSLDALRRAWAPVSRARAALAGLPYRLWSSAFRR
jgi:hypothetical protein